MTLQGQRMLVTGATGVVGAELMEQLSLVDGLSVTGCSSRGDASRSVVAWDMGAEPAPPDLAGVDWDIVIHAAARTRWTQTQAEATAGNIEPALALHQVVGPKTHLVFLSTAHVVGLHNRIGSPELEEYRNAYEWAKAQAEQHATDLASPLTIVRFPMVIGRRTTGSVQRYSGFYQVLSGLTSGLLPAFVGLPDAPVDLVPVDDIARIVVEAAAVRPTSTDVITIGCGAAAPTADRIVQVTIGALNEWREERGVPALDRPPMIPPDRWERFFFPFAKQHFSPLQLRVVELFSVFHPYMSMAEPFAVNHQVPDPVPALVRSLHYWAEHNVRAASAIPTSWADSLESATIQETQR